MAVFKAWWERLPGTYAREVAAYADNGLEFTRDEAILKEKGVIVFRGSVSAAGQDWPLEVIYPSGFPYVRPEVICRTAGLARHQSPVDKNLCLFSNEDSGWTCAKTGADLVNQARDLLQTSAEGPEAIAEREVDAPEPASVYFNYSLGRCLLLLDDPPTTSPGDCGEFTIIEYTLPGGNVHTVLTSVSLNGQSIWKLPSELMPTESFRTITGIWVRCSEAPPAATAYGKPATYEDFKNVASGTAPSFKYRLDKLQRSKRVAAFALIFREEGPKRGEWYENWLLCTQFHGKAPEVWRSHRWTTADRFRRIPAFTSLAEKRIFLLGLGAIGSSVAMSLARAGIGSFCLVDHDVVEPGPLVRQTYDRRDIGLPKVHAMARRILDINPSATVNPVHTRLAGAPTSIDRIGLTRDQLVDAFHELQDVNLLISASGLNSIDYVINDLGASLEIPRIFGWVTNGAWGGRVFRAHPGGACFECLAHAANYFSPPQNDINAETVFARGCGFPTFTGAGFDAEAVANLMTRMAVQTLTSGADPNYPDSQTNLITWNSRGDSPGSFPSIEHHFVERQPQCVVCGLYP